MNRNVATMVARYGTPLAIRKALAAFNAAVPRSDAGARRALIAAAEAAAGPMTFGFSLDAGADTSGTPRGSATESAGEPRDGRVLFDFDLECPVVRFGAPRTADVDKPDSAEGEPANKPDGTAVGMSGGMSEAELAAKRRQFEAVRHLDLLSRTGLGRASLPDVAASPARAAAAADQSHRDRLWAESPSAYYDHLLAVVAGQRRDRQMEASALGRAVLAREKAKDAARR